MDVLIAGGGTGGHLFPGIAVAEEIRRRNSEARILFVGTARGLETRAVPRAGFELELLPVSGLRRMSWSGVARGMLRLPLAMVRAFGVVRRFRPQVAVSVGGYAAGPAVLAAHVSGVPCVVMEQNAVPGMTNRVLGSLARRVLAGLPTNGFDSTKTQVVGNPVRADFIALRERPYVPATPPRLLVFGGSQGARALNEVMMASAPELKKLKLPIVHQTGEMDAPRVQQRYAEVGLAARVTPFIDAMADAYRDADLVLCRAGAMTLAELTACGRPAVLVPFPYAVDDHQTANAKTLESAGAAVHVPQTEFTARRWVDILKYLIQDPSRLNSMAAHAREMGKPDAVAAIADVLEELGHVSR